MGCYSPLQAFHSREIGKSGKRGITFQRSASFSGIPLKLPCGQCIGCRLERSRQWAMRCMHEKRLWSDNCFVTLTYSDEFVPSDGSLRVRDLQLFFKRLRHVKPGLRYYGCGEYGETTRRPHYHVILFNCAFKDAKPFKMSKDNSGYLWTSKELEDEWQNGLCVGGDVTFKSCAYVARYICDKVTGPLADEHYTSRDGVILQPEFTVMSRRPGIGSEYYKKYGHEVRAHDSVVFNGREVRPPRFYDTRTEVVDPELLSRIKVKRRRKALAGAADQTPDRRRVREEVALRNLDQMKRSGI